MEASDIMISSLTVNACVLFVLIVTWILRRRRQTIEEKNEHRCLYEMEKIPAGSDGVVQPSNATEVKTIDIFLLTDVVTSSFCFGAGLQMMASSLVWQCPFVCLHLGSVTPHDAASDRLHFDYNDIDFPAVLAAAFGIFIFTFLHLMFIVCRHGNRSLWSVLRSGYLLINILTIGVILVTRENLLGALLILLMELDVAIDGTCQLVDRCMAWKPGRPARILLSAVGCLVSLGTRIVMTWVMCIALRHVYNPIAMSVLSLSIASFGFIFYQAYAFLVIKQHLERIISAFRDNDATTSRGYTVEPYQGKIRGFGSKRPGTKDVAFYLMSEGFTEISSYAKTVAGAITGKKFIPIKSWCDSATPAELECKSTKSNMAVK